MANLPKSHADGINADKISGNAYCIRTEKFMPHFLNIFSLVLKRPNQELKSKAFRVSAKQQVLKVALHAHYFANKKSKGT
ncbi:MAG: hypothetical protein MUF29_09795 [Chitinophagaceae bacterium]|jgi:hypothetical protein|nr:hypothetical protein [Chitinophagaceae bacterium]